MANEMLEVNEEPCTIEVGEIKKENNIVPIIKLSEDDKGDPITKSGKPDLRYWMPSEDDIYFGVYNGNVIGQFEKFLGIEHEGHATFIIKKGHIKKYIDIIVHHINYYLTFYDEDKELFTALASIKYICDKRTNMSVKSFKKLVMTRIVTPKFVNRVKAMVEDLYCVTINDSGSNYNAPKITNSQAKLINAVSLAIKLVYPLCVHFGNVNSNLTVAKKAYIGAFDKIFKEIIIAFEENDEPIFIPLCEFIQYRIDRSYKQDLDLWRQKKQLYGISKESYLQEVIHEIILVKGLYKLKYWKSVVSFIDGVVFRSYRNFKRENFVHKPIELGAEEMAGNDNDDYLSRAEAIEMSVYRIDSANIVLNEVNTAMMMKKMKKQFGVGVTDGELEFYYKNTTLNAMNQFLIHEFFTKYFKNTNAVYLLSNEDNIKLIVYLKNFLKLKGMSIMPQILTAKVQGKFKESVIKNSKFKEMVLTDNAWQNIIAEKFYYLDEIGSKESENLLLKKLSTIINSSFIVVDTNEAVNGMSMDNLPLEKIISEFEKFLVLT